LSTILLLWIYNLVKVIAVYFALILYVHLQKYSIFYIFILTIQPVKHHYNAHQQCPIYIIVIYIHYIIFLKVHHIFI